MQHPGLAEASGGIGRAAALALFAAGAAAFLAFGAWRAQAEPAGPQSLSSATPRLKPEPTTATPASRKAIRAAAPGRLALVGPSDFPPPFVLDGDLTRPPSVQTGVARAPLAVAYARDLSDGPHPVVVIVNKNEALVEALRRAGVRAEDRNAAAYAFGKHYNLRRLLPGQELALTIAEPNRTLFQMVAAGHAPDDAYLMALEFRIGVEKRLSLKRRPDGGFDAEASAVALMPRVAAVSGRIEGSLYLAAKRAGAPDPIIGELANIFAYDVDFQREIIDGDEFEAIYEMLYDEDGEFVGTGDILYGRLSWRNRARQKGYYRFASTEGGRAEYFDASGESARRLLMKTPIDGARLSSGFGSRRHPILGYMKAHQGVDFAAPRGTPIKAAGSGVVERAGPWSTYGNYIRIRHANGYKTAYAHLNSIRKGIRPGKRVDQGDIIGYVGTTGRSTGPHLHYEVHLNNKPVNPQNLKIATGVTLRGAELSRFKSARDAIDAMRLPAENPPDLLAEADRPKAM
jgi:murein DD-endopeptidase MepM/ murein hydrolase activator NlpD